MPDWPSISRVDDRRMAQSLRDGDADALAQIFDGYGARLYDYCHALLRDRDSAAYALHDAFVVAHAHIGGLREPERFRSWLYALVRNECLRRLSDPERPVERHEAPEVEDAFVDADERARRQEAREFVHSALSGLTGRQREAIDLVLRHDLDTRELAGVIGVSAQQAADLAGEARGRLDDALAAALIARTGREECPSVAALVDTWEWPLTPTVCRKLIRHIGTCPTCTERRKRKMSTTRLMQVLPVALMPADLAPRIFATVTAPDLADERAEIAEWAGPFDVWGWPAALDTAPHLAPGAHRSGSHIWPTAAAAACVAAVVGAGFVMLPRSSNESPRGGSATGAAAAPGVSESVTVSASEPVSESPEPTPSVSTSSPVTRRPATRRPATPTRRVSSRPTTKSPPPKPRLGRLSVTGCGAIGPERTCTLTVTAVGGPMTWSVASVTGVTATGGGVLEPGASEEVTVMVVEPACDPPGPGSGSVAFSPNGSGTISWSCGAG